MARRRGGAMHRKQKRLIKHEVNRIVRASASGMMGSGIDVPMVIGHWRSKFTFTSIMKRDEGLAYVSYGHAKQAGMRDNN